MREEVSSACPDVVALEVLDIQGKRSCHLWKRAWRVLAAIVQLGTCVQRIHDQTFI